ncbi:unnamed protein product [Ilex paraguariensis]|uniref:Uncharacterized protein n=1 Tax=Ilex paraguariensis TaxID=185542 RepID=A0ABC8TNU7_9AQUA
MSQFPETRKVLGNSAIAPVSSLCGLGKLSSGESAIRWQKMLDFDNSNCDWREWHPWQIHKGYHWNKTFSGELVTHLMPMLVKSTKGVLLLNWSEGLREGHPSPREIGQYDSLGGRTMK